MWSTHPMSGDTVITETQKMNALDIIEYLDLGLLFSNNTLDTLLEVAYLQSTGKPTTTRVTEIACDLDTFFLYQTGITSIEQKLAILKFIFL